MSKSKIAVAFAQANDIPVITLTMQRVADTKNCVRYEAADDTIIKSASYLKTDALAVFGDVIPDVLEVTFKAVRAK